MRLFSLFMSGKIKERDAGFLKTVRCPDKEATPGEEAIA